jgi:recombination associated protein RdgC
MGLFSGSLTYRRYRVRDPLPADYREHFEQAIRLRAAEPIDPASDLERAVGWVAFDLVLDNELSLPKFLFGDVIALGFRIETLKVPPSIARPQIEMRRRELARQTDEGLSKPQLKELARAVTQELRQRMLPRLQSFDMVWDLDKGLVRFGTLSKTANELFVELFERTFGLEPHRLDPYQSALELGLSDDDLLRLDQCEPTDFERAVLTNGEEF